MNKHAPNCFTESVFFLPIKNEELKVNVSLWANIDWGDLKSPIVNPITYRINNVTKDARQEKITNEIEQMVSGYWDRNQKKIATIITAEMTFFSQSHT